MHVINCCLATQSSASAHNLVIGLFLAGSICDELHSFDETPDDAAAAADADAAAAGVAAVVVRILWWTGR